MRNITYQGDVFKQNLKKKKKKNRKFQPNLVLAGNPQRLLKIEVAELSSKYFAMRAKQLTLNTPWIARPNSSYLVSEALKSAALFLKFSKRSILRFCLRAFSFKHSTPTG